MERRPSQSVQRGATGRLNLAIRPAPLCTCDSFPLLGTRVTVLHWGLVLVVCLVWWGCLGFVCLLVVFLVQVFHTPSLRCAPAKAEQGVCPRRRFGCLRLVLVFGGFWFGCFSGRAGTHPCSSPFRRGPDRLLGLAVLGLWFWGVLVLVVGVGCWFLWLAGSGRRD